jgi:alpha-1,6-mannosyltransferase
LVIPGKRGEVRRDGRRTYVQVPGIRVPFSGGYRAIVRRKALRKVLLELQPDVIEVSDKTTLAWVPLWAKAHGIRTVLFSHERVTDVIHERFPSWLPVARIMYPIIQKMKSHVDAVVCASRYSADEFTDVADKLRIIPLGVDHDVFHPRDTGVEPTEIPLVLFAGRMSFEKRPHVAVAAARELALRGIRAKFVFAGDGPMLQKLRKTVDELDVEFIGRVSDRNHLAYLMASADVCIAPSPFETFGLSILESLACGTPVIVANSGAGIELISGGCGLAVEPTGAMVADAIMLLLLESRDLMRRRCVQRAREMSWDTCSNEFLDLYTSLVNQTCSAAA